MVFVKKVCDETGPVNCEPGVDGFIEFSEFIKIFTAVLKVQVALNKKMEDAAAVERRKILELPETPENQQKFGLCCVKMMHEITKMKNMCVLAVLQLLKVEPESYEKAAKSLKHNPEKAKEMQAVATSLETSERIKLQPEGYRVLSKEEVLAHVEVVEMKKATAMAGIVMAAQMGKIPKEAVPQAAEVVKLKALDELFKEKGIVYDDIGIAF